MKRTRKVVAPHVAAVWDRLAAAVPDACPWHEGCAVAHVAFTDSGTGLAACRVTFACGLSGAFGAPVSAAKTEETLP